jgi:hypothetical protein
VGGTVTTLVPDDTTDVEAGIFHRFTNISDRFTNISDRFTNISDTGPTGHQQSMA